MNETVGSGKLDCRNSKMDEPGELMEEESVMTNTGQSQEVGSDICQDSILATDTSLYSCQVEIISQGDMNHTDSHTGSSDGEPLRCL